MLSIKILGTNFILIFILKNLFKKKLIISLTILFLAYFSSYRNDLLRTKIQNSNPYQNELIIKQNHINNSLQTQIKLNNINTRNKDKLVDLQEINQNLNNNIKLLKVQFETQKKQNLLLINKMESEIQKLEVSKKKLIMEIEYSKKLKSHLPFIVQLQCSKLKKMKSKSTNYNSKTISKTI